MNGRRPGETGAAAAPVSLRRGGWATQIAAFPRCLGLRSVAQPTPSFVALRGLSFFNVRLYSPPMQFTGTKQIEHWIVEHHVSDQRGMESATRVQAMAGRVPHTGLRRHPDFARIWGGSL